jgi:AcrR family transcriptional regulator
MGSRDKKQRHYNASGRQAAAEVRRLAVVAAAREAFEQRGWAAVRVREIAGAAGVSQKLVEATFGTKAALLAAAVDYAVRGDLDPLPMPRRESVQAMEAAPDAAEMLRLHARHLRLVNARSARIAAVVEHAAPADPAVAALWRQMNRNRRYAVEWATETFLTKRRRRRGLRRKQVAAAFWVALEWGTYRTLIDLAGFDDEGYEEWLRKYYASLLLPPAGAA